MPREPKKAMRIGVADPVSAILFFASGEQDCWSVLIIERKWLQIAMSVSTTPTPNQTHQAKQPDTATRHLRVLKPILDITVADVVEVTWQLLVGLTESDSIAIR